MGTVTKHPVPDRVKPSLSVVFDIRALGGTAAAAPPPFRRSDPALRAWSRPL